MIEPLYYWQVINNRGKPLEDISEEEFNKRLEQLIQDLECAERIEATSWPLKIA